MEESTPVVQPESAEEKAEVPRTDIEEEQPAVEKTDDEQATDDDGMFDVVIAEEKEPEETSGSAEESSREAAVENIPESEGGSDIVAAAKGDVESEFFGEEDFTMETLMDVDINTISPYIKETSKESEAKEKHDELDVVIADGASHTEAISEVAETVEEASADKKKHPALADLDGDIPEETTYTPASELEMKTHPAEDSVEESFADVEDFEVKIAEEPVEKSPDDKSLTEEQSQQEEMTFFESELVTGDDIADTIAALETPPAPAVVTKSEEKPKLKKKRSKKAKAKKNEMKPAPAADEKIKSDVKKPEVKKKDGEESITGDDVVDQIDTFFGLIE